MKLLLQITFLLFSLSSMAQKPFSLNGGKTTEKGYLTTIPYQEIKEKIIVEGAINGKTYKFILDTGAPMTIFKKLAEELNLDKVNDIELTDANNKKDSVTTISLPKIKIGGVTFNNIPTLVVNDSLIACFGVDGLIGSNVFRNSAVQFSSKNKTVTITDSPRRLKLKSKPSKLLLDMQSNPFIWLEHKNGDNIIREQLLFDTGMNGFYDISMRIYKEHFEKMTHLNVMAQASGTFSMGIFGAAAINENYKFRIPEVAINSISFTNVITETTYDNYSRIGAGLLKYGTVTVNYKKKKFYFEPYDNNSSFDLSEKQWPFDAILNDGKLVVGIIWDASLAEQMKPGDVILQFDDINFDKMTICDLMQSSISQINKDKAIIKLKDVETGEIKEFEIEKK